jgi:hypothetical protein
MQGRQLEVPALWGHYPFATQRPVAVSPDHREPYAGGLRTRVHRRSAAVELGSEITVWVLRRKYPDGLDQALWLELPD